MMKKTIVLGAALLTGLAGVAAASAAPTTATPEKGRMWLRNAQISPKGDKIAFTYRGDIWTVPTAGGQATRLTTQPSYETTPLWSPDGEQIAFASDRHGNFDVFVMDAAGGPATRLTTNSTSETPQGFAPDGSEVYFTAAIQAPAQSIAHPTTRNAQLYAVDTQGGKPRQVLPTVAEALSFGPNGEFFLYQDNWSMENQWRKHHTSSAARNLWKYDASTGHHTNLTHREGEDRNPVVSADGKTVYFLSERDGDAFNVFSFPLADPAQITRLTQMGPHPVRSLSRADNGLLAFGYDGDIYTLRPGGQPQKVAVAVMGDFEEETGRDGLSTSGAKVSPDGKQVAFISRGDVFVTSVEYPTTRQITHTPQAEGDLSWGTDNRTLYYASDRSGRRNIYRATIDRKDDPNFANATSFTETALFPDDGSEYSKPNVSPDGKKMTYSRDRVNLWVMDIPSGDNRRQLTDGNTYNDFDDEMEVAWSPDSRWLTMAMVPEMHNPYSDIALLNVASGELTNITRSGYFDMQPRFSHDGNAIIYATDRYGMRNHASWGSQEDVMICFLNRQARDRAMLSEEDLALLKDSEKEAKKAADKPEKAADKKKGEKKADKDGKDEKKAAETKPIVVELDGIEDRIMRLTPYSASLQDAILSDDGETLYYSMQLNGKDADLYKLAVNKREPEKVASLGRGGRLGASADGKTLFVLGRDLKKINPATGKVTPIKVSGNQTIDFPAEREAMFDFMATEEGKRFYNTNMHGVDWPALTAHYREFLPSIGNNYDFAELLSEALGELNVSHTGGRYYPDSPMNADKTASLGLLYDMSFQGDGLKVDEVVADGPFDRAASRMVPGSTVTAVNSTPIEASTDMAAVFNNIAGRKILVDFTLPSGEKVSEVVTPILSGRMNKLLYQRWVRRNAEKVKELSGGRLGYVHIPSMNDESFRPVYADLLGKFNNLDGVVVDIRNNGGGRLHEDIEVLLSGEKYLDQVNRGKAVCNMPSRRYTKPSIMVTNEQCYSNAHGTPWVYQHQKLGKVVGAPVAGTMTSVNWVTMQDPSMVFGIPVTGYLTSEGNYLENTELVPDVVVYNTPEEIAAGEDAQLRTAVETLLRDLDK